jgi:hypothetical protein
MPDRLPRHLAMARPWRSRMGRLLHRTLDAAADAALARDRDPGRAPIHAERENLTMSHEPKPSLVLAELWERRSAKGNAYFSGFMGNVSLALLRDGERPHPTRPDEVVTVWRLVAQERQPKAAARPPGRDEAAAAATGPPERGARPGAAQRHQRQESARARQERVSAEIAAGLGVHGDEDLNDPVPF